MGLIRDLIYKHQEDKRRDVLNEANMYNSFLTASDDDLAGMGYDPATARPWFAQRAQKLFEKEGGPKAKEVSGPLFGMITALTGMGKAIGHGITGHHPVKPAPQTAGAPQAAGGGESQPQMSRAPWASPM